MSAQTPDTSVAETVKRFKKNAEAFRREIKGNPRKAKAFLIRAGIAQKSDTHPSGLELVPHLRSKD